jgi:hypothetical protein
MKKIFFFTCILLCGLCAVFLSCSSNGEENVSDAEIAQNKELAERISIAVQEVTENESGKYDEGGYVVYDSQSDSVIICDVLIYGIGEIAENWENGTVNDTILHNDSNNKKAPSGKGWIYAGTCKGNVASFKFANKIAQRISQDQDFEIHVEPQSDGSSKVLFRNV